MESYVLLWSLDRIKWLKRVNDTGPLEVVFGGPHISQPSIDRLVPGDSVYPISVSKGRLLVLARLDVRELLDPDEYVRRRLGIEAADLSWTASATTCRTRALQLATAHRGPARTWPRAGTARRSRGIAPCLHRSCRNCALAPSLAARFRSRA